LCSQGYPHYPLTMIKTPLTTGDAAQMYCPLIQLQKFHFLEIITFLSRS